jgi:hypothetical protein
LLKMEDMIVKRIRRVVPGHSVINVHGFKPPADLLTANQFRFLC